MATQTNHAVSKKEGTDGWNLASLIPKKEVEKGEYAVKPSKPKLSQSSLEVCTESLGNETGSKVGEEFLEPIGMPSRARLCGAAKPRRMCVLPPPLPSINGCGGVRLEQHRDGGKLVFMVVMVAASSEACFEAERENGRLKLRFKNKNMDEMEGEIPVPESESAAEDDHIKREMVNVEAFTP